MTTPYQSPTWSLPAIVVLDLLFEYGMTPLQVADIEYPCGCKVRQERYIIEGCDFYMEWKTDHDGNIDVGIAKESVFGEVEVLTDTELRAYLDFYLPTRH